MSDKNGGFEGSCGKCLEVRCKPRSFLDGNGKTLSREEACHNPGESIVVTITDACPCEGYGDGNKRWCCGDDNHLGESPAGPPCPGHEP